jgi:hypothetical protein
VGPTGRLRRVGACALAAGAAVVIASCSLFTDLGGFSDPDDSTPSPGDGASSVDGDGDGGETRDGALTDGPRADANVQVDDPYALAVLADGPVAYLRLDDTGGTAPTNLVGTATATLTGACTPGVPGRVGLALELDGSSCRLSLGSAFPFADKAPFTFELWIRPSLVNASVRRILNRGSKSGATTSGYELHVNELRVLTARYGLTTHDGYVAGASPPTTSFTHLVMTYDGVAVRLYTNGVLDDHHASPSSIVDPDDGELVFGDLASGVFYKFAGAMDEIAIYDKALPKERVEAHFDAAP